jgi:hypothetical protein
VSREGNASSCFGYGVGSVGRVGEVGGLLWFWRGGGRVVRVGLGGRCSFSFATTYTKQNSTPCDDGRSKKPNVQAADGIWPTAVGLPSVVVENLGELI